MNQRLKSSFRDPSGYAFSLDGEIFRTVSTMYKKNYDYLMSSGLYAKLASCKQLIPHDEMLSSAFEAEQTGSLYKILKPTLIPFISYPYEWCFSQLKDAAIATLKIELDALNFGMTLKDATAYNIQFLDGAPIFIDTLSFEIYNEGSAWVAYRQFCKHFLAPLALIAYTDYRFYNTFKTDIDGVPLDFASKLLPLKTKFKPGLLMHIHLHSKIQNKFENAVANNAKNTVTFIKKQSLVNLIENLLSTVKGIRLQKSHTQWGGYYSFTNYSDKSFEHKKTLVANFVQTVKPGIVWDLGANNGVFSKIASSYGAHTVAFDIDFNAVESNYLKTKTDENRLILPLIMDLTNPSPGIGWANEERESLVCRANADLVMALAVVHHLSISYNISLVYIADYFAKLGKNLIIEWVPKDDSQTMKILSGREDIFHEYELSYFEKAFTEKFKIIGKENIENTKRILYLMERK